MIKKILSIFIITFMCDASCESQIIRPIKRIFLKKEKDKYYFCIEFTEKTKFTPRIHVHPKGAKIILSFEDKTAVPKTKKINHSIINGYFFEQFGPSSLMMYLSLKENVIFTEKRYTKNLIKLGFKIIKKPLIVIDAGHGGKDFGVKCLTGDYEKNITLIMAIELRNILINREYKVVLLRDSDKFMSTEERINKINAINPDMLISLHTDSIGNKNARGISIYTYTNRDDHYHNIDKTLTLSRTFSNTLTRYIPDKCKIKMLPHKLSELKILETKSPAALIEVGNVSNKIDNQLLHFRPYRERIYYAILYTLNKLFKKG